MVAKKRSWKIPVPIVVVVVVILIGGAFFAGRKLHRYATIPNNTEATVNGQPIKTEEFLNALKMAAGAQVMQTLILQTLVEQEAKKQNINADSDIAHWREMAQKNHVDPKVIAAGEPGVRAEFLLRKLILKSSGVSEAQEQSFYNMFKDQLALYHLSHIVVATREDANRVASDLARGRDWNLVASTYSKDTNSKNRGGDIGDLTHLQIDELFGPQLATVITSLPIGKPSPPLKAPFGYDIVKVDSVRTTFAQLKDEIAGIMSNADRITYVKKMLDAANIKSPYKPTVATAKAPPTGLPSGALLKPEASRTTLPVIAAPSGRPGLNQGPTIPSEGQRRTLPKSDVPSARATNFPGLVIGGSSPSPAAR